MKVKKEMKLIDFLSLSYNRKNVKNLLKYKEVYVNGKQVSQFDYLLKEDDLVEIKKEICLLKFFMKTKILSLLINHRVC